MFGNNKPVVLSYGNRRATRRLPRWLVLLLVGTATGAGGLWLLQERVLPPRLSAEATRALRASFDQADAERKTLRSQLDAATKSLQAAQATVERQVKELAAPRAAAQKLGDELAAVVAALPPDPRGGAVEVRAARFVTQGNMLVYDVVLTRADAARPLAGKMQLSVLGLTARGAESTVALGPVAVSLGAHSVVRGSLPLPDGLRPRQVTVNVLDAAGSQPLGMRVMLVR